MGKATMVFTPAGGGAVAIEPRAGASGAAGIFMPRDGSDQFFPVPTYDEQYAESPDTEGGQLVSSRPQNPVGHGTVLLAGADQASFAEQHQRWQALVEAMRREGGTLAYTPAEGTTVTYEVESMRVASAKYDGNQMLAWVQEMGFEFTCRPYGLLTAVEQTLRDHDPFSRDTLGAGEWAAFTAGSGTLSVSGGVLVPSSTAEKRFHRLGLKAADSSITVKVTTGAAVTENYTLIEPKKIDATNALEAGFKIIGASSKLYVAKREGGFSILSESGEFTTKANTTYWLRVTTAGNVVTVELFASDPDESGAALLKSLTYTLEGANATKFGSGVWANVGLRLIPAGTDYRWDEWRADAKAFRSANPAAAFELPDVPGHVDALGDVTVTETSAQPREHVEVALERGGDYLPAVNPPTLIDSDQMFTAGFAGAQTTKTGAFDPLAAGNTAISAALSCTPLTVCGTGPLSHTGPYRVKARVQASALGPTYVRLASRYGSGQFTRGDWAEVPVMGEWCEVDLGPVAPPVAPAGTQSWEGRVEAMRDSSSTIYVDYLLLLGAGRYMKAKVQSAYETPSNLIASDEFPQTAGTLSGKALANNFTIDAKVIAGTAADDAAVGTVAWTNPNNAKTEGGGAATATGAGATSHYLKLTNLGYAVPAGATILGVIVGVRRKSSGGFFVNDSGVKIVKAGAPAGTAKTVPGTWPEGAFAPTYYGDVNDLWGTTLTREEVNAEGFGVAISAAMFGTAVAEVDSIEVYVCYSPAGGVVWAESGHEPVYKVDATGPPAAVAKREGVGDASATGRFALAGTQEPETTVVQADVQCSVGTGRTGVMARYGSVTAAVALVLTGSPYKVQLLKFSAGPTATIMQKPELGWPLSKVAGQSVTLRLEVDKTGRWLAWADGLLLGQGWDEALVSGKTLGKGRFGLYDEHSAAAVSRWDNFMVWTPELNAALWAGRRVRLRWADAVREDNEGLYWSPPPGFEGGRMRVPPEGPSGLTSRLAVKARRRNVDESVDPNIADELQVAMSVTPRVMLLG